MRDFSKLKLICCKIKYSNIRSDPVSGLHTLHHSPTKYSFKKTYCPWVICYNFHFCASVSVQVFAEIFFSVSDFVHDLDFEWKLLKITQLQDNLWANQENDHENCWIWNWSRVWKINSHHRKDMKALKKGKKNENI